MPGDTQSQAQSAPSSEPSASDHTRALTLIEALRRHEARTAARNARRRIREENRGELLRRLARQWPIGVGLVLGALAPWLQELVSTLHPWVMWLVFPFVTLAKRPEVYMGDQAARILPVVVLYAQFPVEGLLARLALRRHVTFIGVSRYIVFFHFLGAAELWLVRGGLSRFTFH